MREALLGTRRRLLAGDITTGVDQGVHGGMAFDGQLTIVVFINTCTVYIIVLPKKYTGMVVSVNDALKAVSHTMQIMLLHLSIHLVFCSYCRIQHLQFMIGTNYLCHQLKQ